MKPQDPTRRSETVAAATQPDAEAPASARRAGAATGTAQLDVYACPLSGWSLVEASAGTGKTWNICALYLRLLLERGLEVREILVVTFTNAATAELRDRIRRRIADTLAFLAARARGAPVDDGFAEALLDATRRATGLADDRIRQRLEQALEGFDEAAIHTIHGFCQRAIADQAFSAGTPFALELVTTDELLRDEVVHDFWRRRIAAESLPAELAGWLGRVGDTPERYGRLLARSLGKPLARHIWPTAETIGDPVAATPGGAPHAAAAAAAAPAPAAAATASGPDAAATSAALTMIFAAATAQWARERDAVRALLEAALPDLHAGVYKPASVTRAVQDWDAWFASGDPLAPPDGKLHLLAAGTLASKTKKSAGGAPQHPFFDTAQALLEALYRATGDLAVARLALVRDLIESGGPALRVLKRERRVLGFNDMLGNLYLALTGGEHPRLAAALRSRYPAALIDEFQDTDPLQFEIFTTIYGGGSAGDGSGDGSGDRTGAGLDAGTVFLVGDPKQAIYSFRNADLHAYLNARGATSAQYTLAANQRSSGALIAALNGLFGRQPAAFLLPGLDYHAVTRGAKLRPVFRNASDALADLQLWLLPGVDEASALRKAEARALAVRATAAEIARLLAASRRGDVAIDGRALSPGDIAVLVRTHAQGSALKQELAALDVGSVELAQASVLASTDAEEIERVLIAVNEPARTPLLRAALATEMLGHDAAKVAATSADEDALMRWIERFSAYRATWLAQGVGVMLRRLLADQQVAARMLVRTDGERRLTNLLHVTEQLHQAEATCPAPDALLRWLAAQRRDGAADEVAQLRLESDRNLVQIVTIHKAKGLEFPIVFCPFLWDGNTRFGGPELEGREYHDAEGCAVIDFRGDDEIGSEIDAIKARVKLEQAAEMLRLVYVAVTRAVHRCYVVVGSYASGPRSRPHVQEATRSVLNWLVAGGGQPPAAWFAGRVSAATIAEQWRSFARDHAPHAALTAIPEAPGTPLPPLDPAADSLAALPPSPIPSARWVGSFSSLIGNAHSEAAATDHDAHAAEAGGDPEAATGDLDILRFPRGPAAGDALHAVYEQVDFADPSGWDDVIAAAIAAHLPPPRNAREREAALLYPRMVKRMLADVLATPLPDRRSGGVQPGTSKFSENSRKSGISTDTTRTTHTTHTTHSTDSTDAGTGIVLSRIPAIRRLVEMAFDLPASGVSAHALAALLARAGYAVPQLAFRDLDGYLSGRIDLVFEHAGRWYLLDWKSNHLGYSAADYGPQGVATAMADNGYHLQALLYALAVDRYLRLRVPGYRYERHFGGVLYLFVRGVRPGWRNADGSPCGVHFDRPVATTLAALDGLFE